MLEELSSKKALLKRRTFANGKVTSIAPALTALLAKVAGLKELAQAAFASYLRSVFLHHNKAIFDIAALDADAFAHSLGLPTMPRLRMVKKLQKQGARAKASKSRAADKSHDSVAAEGVDAQPNLEESTDDSSDEDTEQPDARSLGATHPAGAAPAVSSEDEEENIFSVRAGEVPSEQAGAAGCEQPCSLGCVLRLRYVLVSPPFAEP